MPNVLQKRGEFIFFSSKVFEGEAQKAEYFDTIKRFRICLTNGYDNFAGRDLEELQKAGCEVFLYFWFNGYYEKELGQKGVATDHYIQRYPVLIEAFRAIHAHPEWLLNPGKPVRGSGAEYPAYFYDYGNPKFRAFYVDFIRRRIRYTQYNGVFFDYIGGWAMPEEAKALWKARYPDLSYDEAGAQFLKELRKGVPKIRIFGNQAYRLPPAYYDNIDYDISESHATSFVWGKEARIYVQGKGMQTVRETFYRPWDGESGYEQLTRQRRERGAQQPKTRFFDLNYVQPWYVLTGATANVEGKEVPVFTERIDRPAIFYGYAMGKLTNASAYASDWYAPGFGKEDLYFLDLGKPLDATYHVTENVVTRYFEKGFVVVTRKKEAVDFAPDKKLLPRDVTGLWDVYEGTRVWDWPRRAEVAIYPASYPATQSFYPSGRVYLYLRSDSDEEGK